MNRLPNVICLECLTKLNNFNEFYTMCHENQVILEMIFENKADEHKTSEEVKEEVEPLSQTTAENLFNSDSTSAVELIQISETTKKPSSSQISCYLCAAIFPTNHKFKQHFQSSHQTNELRYSCIICSKSVLQYRSLTRHMEGHNSEKRFSCDICDRSFSQKITLAQHLNSHSSLKSYTCECGLSFKQNSSLFKHRKKHSTESIVSCIDCNKTFSTNETLRQHRKSRHNLEKDISCSECQKKFASRSALKYHFSSVHQENVNSDVTCKLCMKIFKTSIILSRHVKKIHKS